ncbi:MAG: phage terminase small subunit P27 family [Gammaproteobacteria bacterium]
MQGRKPTPTKLRLLRGNPGKRSLPKDEPKVAAKRPPMPVGMSAGAQAHWRRFAEQLDAARITTELDRQALKALCEACATWDEANRGIAKFGLVVKGARGSRRSPYVGIANTAFEQMTKMLAEFGMTPSSRTRVQSVGGDIDKDAVDLFGF